MSTLNRLRLWLGVLVLVGCAVGFVDAQTWNSYQKTNFTAIANAPAIRQNLLINYHQLTWTVTGTVSACSVALDSSNDGTTFTPGGVIGTQSCTTDGQTTVTNGSANYVRVTISSFTGTGTVQVIYTGWTSNPAGTGSGTVTSVGSIPSFASTLNPSTNVIWTVNSANANTVWGRCQATNGTPGYCQLTANMIPDLSTFYAPLESSPAADGCATFLSGKLRSTGVACGSGGGGGGTVTTVGPSTGSGSTTLFNYGFGNQTTAPSLTFSFPNAPANSVWGRCSTTVGAPSYCSLISSQIPDLSATYQTKLSFTPENSANKGQPNGYAPLGSAGLVPPNALGTGVADSSSCLYGDGVYRTCGSGGSPPPTPGVPSGTDGQIVAIDGANHLKVVTGFTIDPSTNDTSLPGTLTMQGPWFVLTDPASTPLTTAGVGKTAIGVDNDGKIKVSENNGAVVELAKTNSNITGNAAGLTGKTFSGTGTVVGTVTGSLDQNKQVTFDVNGNLVASAFDVGAAGGGSINVNGNPVSNPNLGNLPAAESGFLLAKWQVDTSNVSVEIPVGTVTGTVAAGDDSRITGAAPKASPAFTGIPTAPTAAPGNNSTQLATTQYVDTAVAVAAGGPVAIVTTTASTSAITTTNMYTVGTADGFFSVDAALVCTTSSASATVNVTISWTDPSNTAQTTTLGSAVNCTTLGANSRGDLHRAFRAKASTNITYATSIANTPTYDLSAALSLLASITQVATPSFSAGTGVYNNDQSITISDSTSGAAISYCTNASSDCTPSTSYTSAIAITATATHLCAKATKAGMLDSSTSCQTYTLTASTPTSAPGQGTYGSAQTVTLATTTTGASIRYTTNGSAPACPSTGTLYSSGFTVSTTSTVKAIACKTNYGDSGVMSDLYTISAGSAIGITGGCVAQATSCTNSAVAAGDLVITVAFRNASNTAPTLPATGWTQISVFGAGSGAPTGSVKVGCHKATDSSDTSSGTWTNATKVASIALSGTPVNTTADCNTTGIGATSTNSAKTNSTVTFNGLTLNVTNGTSWVVTGAGMNGGTSGVYCDPTSITTEQSLDQNQSSAGIGSTHAGVASWSSATCNMGDATGAWLTWVGEVLSQ